MFYHCSSTQRYSGRCRYVCSLLNLLKPLMSGFSKLYNRDGIIYNYISCQYSLKVIEDSVTESVVILSSCRYCLTVISSQNMDYAESVSEDSWITDTIAINIKEMLLNGTFNLFLRYILWTKIQYMANLMEILLIIINSLSLVILVHMSVMP